MLTGSPQPPRNGAYARARVPVERLTTHVDERQLGFTTVSELPPLEGTIGQERALRSLKFGLGIRTGGFNVFVSGMAGSGRNTALASYLGKAASGRPVPGDWVYVHNFREPMKPRALSVPAGKGRTLCGGLDALVREARGRIPGALESDQHRRRVQEGLRDVQARHQRLLDDMVEEARRRGIAIQLTPVGVAATPLTPSGDPLEREAFERMSAEEQRALQEQHAALMEYVTTRMAELRRLEKEAARQREQADREVAGLVLQPLFDELREELSGCDETIAYLREAQDDMMTNLQQFRAGPERLAETTEEMAAVAGVRQEEAWSRYRGNLFVDNSRASGAPVVFEYSPTYYNVFGRIEHRLRFGAMSTDFTMLHAGAAHRANGGYLVLQAKDVLAEPAVWQALKAGLRTAELRIENLGEQYAMLPITSLSPEPIPMDVKIVLVGSPMLARLLFLYDEDFSKYFKVRADFDSMTALLPDTVRNFASFVVNRVRDEGLRDFHASAVARLVEFSSRIVEDQGKLSTRFAEMADLITEANYWAGQASHEVVSGGDVGQAIAERRKRSNLIEDRLQEMYTQDVLRVAVDGAEVGQVNGLAVIDMGDYSFGRPSRVTARVSAGRGELSNIQDTSRLSGPIHTKGFQILSGYLMGKYGVDGILPIRASVAFEQTYEEVEGDSASSTELYALLSAIAGVPLLQGLAVTGSVDQQGHVQAVGGVTRKVEGFYEVCKAKGLTGRQGVIIPAANVRNLVLSQEVVSAVADGKFAVFTADTIDEGLELLTGLPAGQATADGTYPPGTVNRRVFDALRAMGERMRGDGGERRQVVTQVVPAPPADRTPVPPPAPTDKEGRDRREGDGAPPSPPPA